MIGIQPPAYFPPLAYMGLVWYVDHFIVADTFRYRRKTFQNRSKLRNAQGGHWIAIPLFGRPHGARLHSVEIETGGRWREKHWRSFKYDYQTTMYFDFFEERFRPFFETEWKALSQCTCRSLELQAELFQADTRLTRASSLSGSPSTVREIASAIGAESIVLPQGRRPKGSLSADVQVFEYDHPTYRQNFEGFVPGVTALDLLFNYGREARRILAQGIRTSDDSAASARRDST